LACKERARPPETIHGSEGVCAVGRVLVIHRRSRMAEEGTKVGLRDTSGNDLDQS